MTKERDFRFPVMFNDEVLAWVEEKVREGKQLREAVALRIVDEAVWLWYVSKKFLPNDRAAFIAIREYGAAGSMVLETVKDLQSGEYEGGGFEYLLEKASKDEIPFLLEKARRVELLKLDPKGCELVDWWGSCAKNFQNSEKEEERAIYYGRANAQGRYRSLYNLLTSHGVKVDVNIEQNG
ncbi:MAG: hypothetical protein Q8Q24_00055 [bacterium]|nr:hypothetical protein [bacterium]